MAGNANAAACLREADMRPLSGSTAACVCIIVELADERALFLDARHPYTEALLSAVPVPNPKLKRNKRLLQGDVPSPINPPSGCTFHTRCPYAVERCRVESPALKEVGPGHLVSCHLR